MRYYEDETSLAPYIVLGLIYLPFAGFEYFKYKHALYSMILVGLTIPSGFVWSYFFFQAPAGFMTFIVGFSVLNLTLIVIFNPICNGKLLEQGFLRLREMDIEELKEVIPDKSDEFKSEFLTNLKSIEQLKSTKMGSYDQNFEIVEIKFFEDQNWSALFIDSSARKTLVILSLHEKKMKFYSLPTEEDYKMDLILFKCLERLQ
jgi:hypothetical protein